MVIETRADAIMLRWTPDQAGLREWARRPAFRRQMAKSMSVAATLLVVGLVLVASRTAWAIPLGLYLAVTCGIQLVSLGLAPRRSVRLRWKNDPLIQCPVEYVVDERGLSFRQQDSECWWGWSWIRDVEENSRAFILIRADGALMILAKRGLASPADESRLRELLGAQVRRSQAS
jgi:hypothetical protein